MNEARSEVPLTAADYQPGPVEVRDLYFYEAGIAHRNTELVPLLDVIDGIVDDTHPEGDGCPLCTALDELRALIEGEKP